LAKWLRPLEIKIGALDFRVHFYEGLAPGSRHRVFFLDCPSLFDREGIYGPPSGGDFWDNGLRFALLGRGALELCKAIDFWPDVVHGHDWQAGPALLYADQTPPRPRLVMTVHNLMFKGLFPSSVVSDLDLPSELFHPEGYEFFGEASFLKAGLAV